MMYVRMGDGAQMAFTTSDECWLQRYRPTENKPMALAEALDSYRYLVLECTKEEVWRRIKLLREATKDARLSDSEKDDG